MYLVENVNIHDYFHDLQSLIELMPTNTRSSRICDQWGAFHDIYQ